MSRMKDRKSKKAKRTSLRIPGMKDVEGRRPLVAEGEYTVKVASIEQREGQNDPYFAWEFVIDGGKFDGAKLYHNTSLSPKSLWNLRGVLEALGIEVPDDETDMDIEDFIDRECVVSVGHETYEGKPQARIVDILPSEEATNDDDEDHDKAAASSSKRGKDKRSRDESEDEDDEPRSKKRRRARDDDDGEEDEPKSKKKSKKKSGVSRDELMDMSEEELTDVIGEHELDVDLDDFSTLRKKKAAVADALADADLLDD